MATVTFMYARWNTISAFVAVPSTPFDHHAPTATAIYYARIVYADNTFLFKEYSFRTYSAVTTLRELPELMELEMLEAGQDFPLGIPTWAISDLRVIVNRHSKAGYPVFFAEPTVAHTTRANLVNLMYSHSKPDSTLKSLRELESRVNKFINNEGGDTQVLFLDDVD